jgi:hypothetical protein
MSAAARETIHPRTITSLTASVSTDGEPPLTFLALSAYRLVASTT